MKIYVASLLILSTIIVSGKANHYENSNDTIDWDRKEDTWTHQESKVLSRRKRFLIFPDGSSFQLVFCTQNQGYLRIGDIIWFGNTAALAWELPTDPSLFDLLRERSKFYEGNRRSDKQIYYLDEYGKVLAKVPYHKRPIVNPAFAKRSVDFIKHTKGPSIKKMHDMQKNANYLDSLHEKSIEFHRSGRKSLYVKVEKVLQALGWNGRECVLRMLCESSKDQKEQGTFLEEIIRATFTLPKGRAFEADHHRVYDEAHGAHGRCDTQYPSCEDLHGLQLYDTE